MRRLGYSCLLWFLSAAAIQAEERYFVVFFASQNQRNAPRFSHTFATFFKVDQEESNGVQIETSESATISWLPSNGVVRLLQRPVAGRNFTLDETLDWAKRLGLATTARGPFEISKELYERALERKTWLESGRVAYKALDRRFRPEAAINCIHAVSDLLPGPLLDTGTARGEPATAMVANHFRPWLKDPDQPQLWALRHLDLGRQGIFDAERPSLSLVQGSAEGSSAELRDFQNVSSETRRRIPNGEEP